MNKKEIIKRIRALVEFVESIPDTKLNMNIYNHNDIGCVLYHNAKRRQNKKKVYWTTSLETALKHLNYYVDRLFAILVSCDCAYPEPTGKAAKKEFKKRADELIAQL